jgi:hypothetical protein
MKESSGSSVNTTLRILDLTVLDRMRSAFGRFHKLREVL